MKWLALLVVWVMTLYGYRHYDRNHPYKKWYPVVWGLTCGYCSPNAYLVFPIALGGFGLIVLLHNLRRRYVQE